MILDKRQKGEGPGHGKKYYTRHEDHEKEDKVNPGVRVEKSPTPSWI